MRPERQTLIPGVHPADLQSVPGTASRATRTRRLRVIGNFQGKREATITFTPERFTVRPLGSHTVYAVELRELAELVIKKAAKR